MLEINFEDLDAWYQAFLEDEFGKLRKNARKILEKIVRIMFDMQNAVQEMDAKEEEVSSELAKKSVDRFTSKMKAQFDDLEIPEEVTYMRLREFVEEIKKFFMNVNQIGRQNIPKFAQEYKDELKTIDYVSRKLSREHVKLDKFIRKKYQDAREAELLITKTDKLEQTMDKIARLHDKVDELEAKAQDMSAESEEWEQKLLDLENQPELQELSKLEKEVFRMKNQFRGMLKFRKVFNKIQTGIKKGRYTIRGVTAASLRDYLKDPINTILAEGEAHRDLTSILVQVRYALENDEIPIKRATREKVIENINQIVGEEKLLAPVIRAIKEKQARIAELKKAIEKKGWRSEMDEIREEIAQLSERLDHLQGDIENNKNQYSMALEKLKQQREYLQEELAKTTGEDIKIQITFQF